MKKESPVKYPHSSNLFQFCRKVLDHKFGGIRVIDQDVGQILGFDPADCSHWKKGKKNIRSIQAMKSIADHLGVGQELVVDVASGEIDDQEAFYEYCKYGMFFIDDKLLEVAKKEYYRRNANTWTRDKEQAFREHFDVNEPAIDAIVEDIHTRINYSEAPLYLPEIVAEYPEILLTTVEVDDMDNPVSLHVRDNVTEIRFPTDEKMRPFIRYQIAKTMASYFFTKKGLLTSNELGEYSNHVRDIQSNIFAAKLLTPAPLLRKELGQVNMSKDIISQLAEIFWVSKTFMNRRLKEILEKNPRI